MSAPRILLLGADGQVGWELRRSLLPLGDVLPCTRQQADFSDLPALRALLDREQPSLIVNAAAYTAVDQAESDPAAAQRINAEAPAVLADYAAASGAWLLHYSTDYVFDGRKPEPYVETDAPNPQSAYGRSKLEGEQAIAASGCRHLILRTSWVYAARGGNFAKTMLRLAAERERLRVIADQFGAPTSAELIADVTALLIQRLRHDPQAERLSGLYHLTAQGATSWHGYARLVIEHARRRGWALRCVPENIDAITTADYPLPAPRPANSRLDCSKLQTTFDLHLPPWPTQVQRLIDELTPNTP
ncbi:dTDP-4-dehydrorhamnose reductase [Thiomonas sp.]|uniref:dTDP-4-dehydrorhamnose reductase n=1 Tax=Thiomonas sp. TaxID=2047785 RepID=UPI002602756A|nr:dTDP-4-dehydrorhamnose reductase [Thiomonas sp.]